jgi:hypothetical protein
MQMYLKYVDDQINFAVVASAAGLDVKQSVRTATTANVGTYTATAGFYKRSDNWGNLTYLTELRLLQQIILVKNSTNGAARYICSYYSRYWS